MKKNTEKKENINDVLEQIETLCSSRNVKFARHSHMAQACTYHTSTE